MKEIRGSRSVRYQSSACLKALAVSCLFRSRALAGLLFFLLVAAAWPAHAVLRQCYKAPSGSGPYASEICWLDWSAVNATSYDGFYEFNLGGGITVQIKLRALKNGVMSSIEAAPAPPRTELQIGTKTLFGVAPNYYQGLNTLTSVKPVLYGVAGSGNNNTDFTINFSEVKAYYTNTSTPVRGYAVVSADGEITFSSGWNFEKIEWTSNARLTQIADLKEACSGGWTGNGTTEVTCQSGNTAKDQTGIPVLLAKNPSWVKQQLVSKGGGNQGGAFGFMLLPDLEIEKSVSPAPMVVDQPAVYRLTVTNKSDTKPTSGMITVTDEIPAGLTIGALPAGCTSVAQKVTCTTMDVLETGGTKTFDIPVTPAASLANMQVTNTAYVSGGNDPSCSVAAPCSSEPLVTDVETAKAPRLSIAKSVSANPMIVGVPATYTLTVTNIGNGATTATTFITDAFDARLAPGAMPAGCSKVNQNVSCTIPAGFGVGGERNFVIPVTPTAVGTDVRNTAYVSGGGDNNCPSPVSCASAPVIADIEAAKVPKLKIEKTVSASPMTVGVSATYTLKVSNTGTAVTSGEITVSDTIPSGLNIGAMSAGCSNAGQVVTCATAETLDINGAKSFTINVTPTVAASGIINIAKVSGGSDPACTSVTPCASDPVETDVEEPKVPQLAIKKTVSPSPMIAGQSAAYTLTVANNGTGATTAQAVITDNLPSSLTIMSAPGCLINNQKVTCNIASLVAHGGEKSFTITVTPKTAVTGLINTASVTGGGDPACSSDIDCTDSETTDVLAPRLALAKSVSASPMTVGVSATYTLKVSNTGTAVTSGEITVSDTIPSGLSIGAMSAGCSNAGQVVTCASAEPLAIGDDKSFTIEVTPTASLSGAKVNNIAKVSGGSDPACTSVAPCASDPVITDVEEAKVPKLTIVKTTTPESFSAGVPAAYVLTVTNSGTGATTDVATVTDVVPASLTLGALPSDCTAAGQTVTCTIVAGFASGAVTSFTLPVTPGAALSGTSVSNTAEISGGGDAECPGAERCSSTTDTSVGAPQLALVKTATPESFSAGVPAAYVLTVTNQGTVATTDLTKITDEIPSGLTIGALPVGCMAAGQTVTCTIDAGLVAGAVKRFTLPVTPNASGTLTNSATVEGGGDPACPDAARCTSEITTPVNTAQLTMSKQSLKNGIPASGFTVGDTVVYRLTVTNTGNGATTEAATVTDVVPASLTLGALPSDCTANGQTVTCAVDAGLAAGASKSFDLSAQITRAGTYTNFASLSGGDPDCTGSGNDATHCSDGTDISVGTPQLSINKTLSPSAMTVGEQATYTLTVSNTGDAGATGAVVTDLVPADLTIDTVSNGCSANGQKVTCAIASLAAGSSIAFEIKVTPTTVAAGSRLSNTASVSGGGDDACPAAERCSSTIDGNVNEAKVPKLKIEKTVSASPMTVGVSATYTLKVSNTGTAVTTGEITVSDTIPSGLSIGAMSAGCSNAGQVVTCTSAEPLAIGDDKSFTIEVTPTVAAANSAVSNTAYVSGGGDDTCPLVAPCASDPVETDVEEAKVPKLKIEKTLSASPMTVGVSATYTLKVSNTGTAVTSGEITVSDTIPSGLSIGAMSAGCSNAGQVVTCTSAEPLAIGDDKSFTIEVTPTVAAANSAVSNTAYVSGGGDDTCPLVAPCASDPVETDVEEAKVPKLKIEKTLSASPMTVGVSATYTLKVSNTGTAVTTGEITVSDTIPSGLSIGAMSAGCSNAGQVVTCTSAEPLVVGDDKSFTIEVTPTASLSGAKVNNIAKVSGGSDPACTSVAPCASDPVITDVEEAKVPKLKIEKTVSASPMTVGVSATYTLKVSNTGTAVTSGEITVSDTIPSGLSIGAMSAGCSNAGQVVTCASAEPLAIGDDKSFTIEVTPTASLSGAKVNNIAKVSGGSDPACTSVAPCASDPVITDVEEAKVPKLTIVKTTTPESFSAGVPAAYVLTVTNSGTGATTDVATVTDVVPASLTLGALPSDCTAAGQTVTCTIVAGFASGAVTSFTLPVTPGAALSGTSVSNTAEISGGGDAECPGAERCSSTTDTSVGAPQLALVKTATPESFSAGVPAAYVLTVTNQGTVATTDLTKITDEIPSGLTIGALPVGCMAAGQTVTCTIDAGLVAGAVKRFTLPVTPNASGTLTNSATVEGGGDPACPDAARCTSEITTPVNTAQLTMSKQSLKNGIPASGFTVGDTVVYRLTVTNTGNGATTEAATVTDVVPASLTLGALPSDCTANGQTVTCAVDAGLAAGASKSFDLSAQITRAGTYTNFASLSGGDPDCTGSGNDATHCSDGTDISVGTPQLSINKTLSPSAMTVGEQATYTLTVSNTGDAGATGAVVTDLVPADLTIDTVSNGCSANGQKVTCAIASLAAGSSIAFEIKVTPTTVAAGSRLSNTASVSGGGDDACPAAERCSSTIDGNVNEAKVPKLKIEKTVSASPMTVGVSATYTLKVSNTGTAVTTGEITVSDTIPSGLSIGAMSAGCSNAGQVVTCTSAEPLAIGDDKSFTIEVTPTVAAANSAVSNTAYVSGGGDDTCPLVAPCASDPVETDVEEAKVPKLKIEKTLSASPMTVGVSATYTLKVSNTGTAVTTGEITVSDTIPSGLSIGAMSAGCSNAGQVVTCTSAEPLAIGDDKSFTIEVTPTVAAANSAVSNTAYVSGGGDDTCPLVAPCASDPVETDVEEAKVPKLKIEKTVSASPMTVGVSATYTLKVSNTGTAVTSGEITVSDTIPSGLSIGAMSAGCSNAGQVVTCASAEPLAIGDDKSFTIEVTPTASLSGAKVNNIAKVSGGSDPACTSVAPCASDPVITDVEEAKVPKLTIVKTTTPESFSAGVPAAYVLTVTNSGTGATTDVATVTDVVPASLTLGALPSDCTAAGQTVTCTIVAGFASGAVTSFTLPVTPGAALSGTSVSNTAEISGGGDAECPGAERCSSTTDTSVGAPQLALVKTATPESFSAGVPAAYVLTVTNQGTVATTDLTKITDEIPSGLTIGALPVGCMAAGQTVTCTIDAGLVAGAVKRFTLPVTPNASGTLTNSATVEGGGDPACPDAARCTSEITTPVNTAQLTMSKQSLKNGIPASGFTVGDTVVYRLTVTNTGNGATTEAATVTDVVPASLTLGALPSDCTANGQTVTCAVDAGLAAGASKSFDLSAQITRAGTYTNFASLSGGDPDCTGSGNDATHCSDGTDISVGTPQLSINKTLSPSAMTVGEQATYTLTVSNTGDAGATGAVVTDLVPADLTIDAVSNGCSANGQKVTCAIASLAAGSSIAFEIKVTPTTVAAGSRLSNTASVSGGGDDACPAAERCSSTIDGNVNEAKVPKLKIEKTVSASPMTVGVSATYTLKVSNTGTAVTTGEITVSDTIPSGLSIGAMSAGCSNAGQVVTCTSAEPLAIGDDKSFTIEVTPTASLSGAKVNNIAKVSGGSDPACTSVTPCASDPVETDVEEAKVPKLKIEKTVSASPMTVGVSATYTLKVSNTGTAVTSGEITVSDTIPSGLSIGAMSAGCSNAGQAVTCTSAEPLAIGDDKSFTIEVTPTASLSGAKVNNIAYVSGGGDDTCPLVAPCASDPVETDVEEAKVPKLKIEKTVSASPMTVGVSATYTLKVTNTGTAVTSGEITVSDTIPSGLSIGAMSAGCSNVGQVVTCTSAEPLTIGDDKSFTIEVTPTVAAANSAVSNTAYVSGGGDDTCPLVAPCASDPVETDVEEAKVPKLKIEKTLSASPMTVGVSATYTLKVSNIGTAVTTGEITVSDTIPSGLSIGAMSAGCSNAGQVVTCTSAEPLAIGDDKSFTIEVTPTVAAANSAVINTAYVSGGGDDTCPLVAPCASDPVETDVEEAKVPKLKIEKTVSASPMTVGVSATYTLKVSNTGTAVTSGEITVSDTIPSGLSIGAMSAGCSNAGQVVTCASAEPLAIGDDKSFTIEVTPTASLSGAKVNNIAKVSGGSDPACTSVAPCASDPVITDVEEAKVPKLTIVKTTTPESFSAGVPAAYVLTVTNSGTGATTDVATVTDVVPASLTLGALPSDCTAAGQTVTCTIVAGFASGAVTSFTLPVTPGAALSGTSVSNTAEISGGGDAECPGAERCSSTTDTSVGAPQLALVKTATPESFSAGVPAAYVLTVTNQGTVATTDLTKITDEIPSGLTIGALPVGCMAAGQTVTCTIDAGLVAGAVKRFTLPVTPNASGTLTNSATVEGGGDPACPDAARCTSEITTPVNTAQLTMSKQSLKNGIPASGFTVGDTVVYRLTVTNTGNGATTEAATVTDVVPASLTLGALPSDCTANGQTVTCAVDAGLAAGASKSFDLSAQITRAGTYTNFASLSGGDPDCTGSGNDATHCSDGTDISVGTPQLSINKTLSPSAMTVGEQATYTLTVSNTGDAGATGAVVTDLVPADLTIDAVSNGCSANGQKVTCAIASLAAGSSIAFEIKVTPTTVAAGSRLSNTASVSGGGDDACPAAERCSSTIDGNVNEAKVPKLKIEKTVSASPMTVGVSATYTLKVSNTGTAVTTGEITVSDTIPSGLSIGAMSAGCSNAGQVVTCTSAEPLAIGDDKSFTIEVTPTASLSGAKVNNIAKVSGGSDPACTSVTPCASDPVETDVEEAKVPKLKIEKTVSASPMTVGVSATYTLKVSNTGTAVTSGEITVSDTIPSGLSIGAMSAGCSNAGQAVTCTSAEPLAIGDDKSFTIEVTPTASLSGAKVNNIAYVSGGGDDTCPLVAPCASDPVETDVEEAKVPKLKIEKTVSASPMTVGVSATYTLKVTNTGTAVTSGEITVSDTIPSGLSIGAMSAGCSNVGQVVTCTSAEPLTIGDDKSFTIEVTPTASLSGAKVNNIAKVSGGSDPACTSVTPCASDPVETDVEEAKVPKLKIEKTVSASPMTVGVSATYTLKVSNTGTAVTTGEITVSDTIPSGLSIGAMSAGCSNVGQVVTCTSAEPLAIGDDKSFTIEVTPTVAAANSAVSNTAYVSGGGDDTCPLVAPCASDPVETDVEEAKVPKLKIEKTVSASPMTVGVSATYTLKVSNTGTAVTSGEITVSDTIPSGLSIGAMSAGCSNVGQVVTCTSAEPLDINGAKSFTIEVTPTASLSGAKVNNIAKVSGGSDPACTSVTPCASDPVETDVEEAKVPKLTIVKTMTPESFSAGVPAAYVLTVTNTGNGATSEAATVTDVVPASLTLGALPSDCTAAGQTVTCTIVAGFASGAVTSFTLPVTPGAALSGTSVSNTAEISGGGDAECPGAERCSSTTDTSVGAPQLALVKTATPESFSAGVPAAYVLTVTNQGTVATTDLTKITDEIPSGLTIGALPVGCMAAGQTVTCTIDAGLVAGAVKRFTLPVTPNASGTLTNSATVEGGGDPACPDAARCTSEITTPVNTAQLTMSKQSLKNGIPASGFTVGDTVVYRLTVTNTGNGATTEAATVTDVVPASLTLGALPSDCTANGQTVTCAVDAGLAAGASKSFDLSAQITRAGTYTNFASLSGGDPDCTGSGNDATHCSDGTDISVGTPQLSINKTLSPSAMTVGEQATYTLTVSNTGDAGATGAVVTDLVPADLTIDTVSNGCSANGQKVTCAIASLAAGSSIAFEIKVTPTTVAAGSRLSNTASVSGGGDDACPAAERCSSTIDGNVNEAKVPKLKIEKTVSASPMTVGVSATYTLKVRNTGTAVTSGEITVSDTIPSGLSIGAMSAGCSNAGQVVTCTSAEPLAIGDDKSFTIEVTPTVAAANSAVSNTAYVSGGGDDTCPLVAPCASDPVETDVEEAKVPKLKIEKTLSASPMTVGVSATYTLKVSNTGTAVTTGEITVSDTIPSGLSIGAMSAGCSNAGQVVTCTSAEPLAIGDDKSFTIEVTPTVAASGIINIASVIGGGDPGCLMDGDCTGSTTDDAVVPSVSSVQLAMTVAPSTVAVGQSATYTLSATNNGTVAAAAMSITAIVPSGLTIGVLPAGCTRALQVVTCTINAGLAVGGITSFAIPVTTTVVGTFDNTAELVGGGINCTMANPCSANASLVVTQKSPIDPDPAKPIPVTNSWMLVVLAALLGGIGWRFRSRRMR